MEVVEKKEMVHKDVYESGEKEYASKGVAAVEVGTDTVQRSLYNPLCPCAGYSNSILFEPTTTPAA